MSFLIDGLLGEVSIGSNCTHEVKQEAIDRAMSGMLCMADIVKFVIDRFNHGKHEKKAFFFIAQFF